MLPVTAALQRSMRLQFAKSIASSNANRISPSTSATSVLTHRFVSKRFSTLPVLRNDRQHQQHTEAPKTENPTASSKDTRSFQQRYVAALDELGVSKNLRIVLFVLLSILGTMETWFWCKAIYIWYKGGKVEGQE